LTDLVDATTRDLKVLDAIETESLESRINARAVVVLPWLVLIVLTARAGPFRDFYRSSGGVVTLLIAAGASALGVLTLGRLGREPDEPRVFGRSS
jgi:Flp pilus assembly protein TadB